MLHTQYRILETVDEVKQLAKYCKQTKYCSFDFETTGTQIFSDDFYPTIIGVSPEPSKSFVIPLGHFDSPFKHNWKKILKLFGQLVIEDPEITKVAWNWKFDQKVFRKYGVEYSGRIFDAMLAKYTLDEERPNDLKSMVERYLPDFGGYENYEGSKLPWDKKPLVPLSKYCAIDCDATLRLMLFFETVLLREENFKLYKVFRNMLMMASRVLLDSEYSGMKLDVEFNQHLRVKYAKLIEEKLESLYKIPQIIKFNKHYLIDKKSKYIYNLEEEIENLESNGITGRQITSRQEKISRVIAGDYVTKEEQKLGEVINFGSVKQLAELLYNSKYGFKFEVPNYTETGNPSTAEDDLLGLVKHDESGFLKSLIEYRKLCTINSTFVVGIGDSMGNDGNIHPRFLIHGTITGRMSCVDYNSKLLTNFGEINIGDICPTTMGKVDITSKHIKVLSHDGEYHNITHSINKGLSEMYEVTLSDGNIVECTMDHYFITNHGKKKLRHILGNSENSDLRILTLIGS